LDSPEDGAAHSSLASLFQELASSSEDPLLLINCAHSQVVECNEAFVRMLRAEHKGELTHALPWAFSPLRQPDGRLSEEKFIEMKDEAERKWFHSFEWLHQRMDGELLPVEVAMTLLHLEGGRFLHLALRDLSAKERAQAAYRRLQRAKDLLAAGSRVLIHAADEQALLGEMCGMAVETGGYRMAWVGYRQADHLQSVRPVAHAGRAGGYLEKAFISWGDNPNGAGPTGSAIRTGSTQIIQDFQHNPSVLLWRAEAMTYGLHSCIALPLRQDGAVFGAMTLYAEQADAFDTDEVQALEKMAAKLSYGVCALRARLARRHAEQGLERAHSLLQAAMEATADGILVTALNGDVDLCNQTFARMFRIDATEACGKNVVGIIAPLARHPEEFGRQDCEERSRPEREHDQVFELADGRVIGRITRPHMLDGAIIGQVCSFRDITAQVRHEQELLHHATHDTLTGLPSRTLLSDRIGQAITRTQRSGSLLAVIFLDIDRFKLVNDSMGHDAGDGLLIHVASTLSSLLRKEDTLARVGGDEFVILLENLAHEPDAARVAHGLLQALARPVAMGGREVFPTASMGIALYPRDGEDAFALLRHADAAMHRAKHTGGNGFQFFMPELQQDSLRKLELTGLLRRAIHTNQLEVHYQPQLSLRDGRIACAEALLRWCHPVMGAISPAEFIPIAEETGLISELFAWTIKTVCADLGAWQRARLPEIRIGINVSPRQFDAEDLAESLSGLLAETGTPSRLIELEITESALMQRPERAVSILGRLRAQGFVLAIDDFGTGYSSLAYLMRFPVNKLKIDRSFIANIPESRNHVSITRAVIAMAHELGIQPVAEGVETDAQKDFLAEHHCDLVQGFLIGRPAPGAHLKALLLGIQ
jgi:diguanylate cyclase (GGDEF)-like protein/PAS domain S-box-containing protein